MNIITRKNNSRCVGCDGKLDVDFDKIKSAVLRDFDFTEKEIDDNDVSVYPYHLECALAQEYIRAGEESPDGFYYHLSYSKGSVENRLRNRRI